MRAPGMPRPVQRPGCGYRGEMGGDKEGEGSGGKGKVRLPPLPNYSLVGEARKPHDN